MRDLVDIMRDEESMIKVGMKILSRDENSEDEEEDSKNEDIVFGSLVHQYSCWESEYTLRESHLQDKRYRLG